MSLNLGLPMDLPAAANDAGGPSDRALKSGGGGDNSGGMGPWETSVDRRLDQLHADQRDILRLGIGAFVLAFGAIVTSFLLLSAKIESSADKIDQRLEKVAGKIDALTSQTAAASERLAKIEARAPETKPAP